MDNSSLTSVSASADRKTTSAGGGTQCSVIHSKLDAIGLAIVGGRVFNVGLVDLPLEVRPSVLLDSNLTQRQVGNHDSRFGFVCDNIANFEVGLPKILPYSLDSETQ